MKTVTYIQMEYDEFDKLVNKHIPEFKGEYEFVACHEANNYSCYKFAVKDDKFYEKMYNEHYKDEILSGETNNTHSILHHLYKMGVIEAGNYLITVYW